MTDEEEELGTDQVPADAMRSTPPWQAEPERKEAMGNFSSEKLGRVVEARRRPRVVASAGVGRGCR